MKKKMFLFFVITIIAALLAGCQYQQEFYNDKDKSDFSDGAYVKFDFVQLNMVMDENTLKENKLDGNSFLFMREMKENSKGEIISPSYYYGYLKNKNGAIYFAKIPASKVRIYEDADYPCIVAYEQTPETLGDGETHGVPVNNENKWENYDVFNLHLPKGTIVPRIKFLFNSDDFKAE